MELFAKQLKISKSCGKIILESDPYQDFYLIQAHNRLQSSGSDDKQFSGYEYRKLITSLSLVSKLNHDIDVQIADALAPIAGMKYNVEKMNKKISMNTMERMKKRLIDRKLADKENPSFFHILV